MPMKQIRYEVWHLTYLTCQFKIEHPRDLSCELGKLNGLLLEFGEGGRLGNGGHMENPEQTPKFKLAWVCGWIGNLRRLSIFIKYMKKPREGILIIWEICICEERELVDDQFLALANFEGERFLSKLVFGEATQIFPGDVMEYYFQV